ncbi:hypothetical protein H6775_00505 [Candidatus Nomurabacteria bacterium]|nr:hypothetical protein [Candidatus Nomurabacteria bacterium]
MKTKANITIKNKIYSYALEKNKDGTIHFTSKDAKIDQNFLAEDIPELILDLPNLIIAEQKYNAKKGEVIRFRVSAEDKKKIEQKAIKKGYDSVSKYLKDIALT